MSFEIRTVSGFEKSVKSLMKKYRSLKSDLADFISSLEENPFQGVEICPGIRKIRMSITSKGKGKSGGARVITKTIVYAENEGRVYLIEIYDKSQFSSVDVELLKKFVEKLNLDSEI